MKSKKKKNNSNKYNIYSVVQKIDRVVTYLSTKNNTVEYEAESRDKRLLNKDNIN